MGTRICQDLFFHVELINLYCWSKCLPNWRPILSTDDWLCFYILEQCWNFDWLSRKETFIFLLFFLLRKSKLNEGRDSTLRLFIFPFSFLSWFSVSSRDVFVLLVRLSVCGSAYWSRLLLKFVFSLVIVSINEQVILLLRYAFSFKVFHKIFETSTGQRICDLFFCTKGDCVLIRELMYTNILAAKKILWGLKGGMRQLKVIWCTWC